MSVETVRMLIPDLGTGDLQVFTDPQIEAFLALNGDNVRRAAADALAVVASDEILTYKITRADDQSVNGVTGAEALLRRAATLREQADEADGVDAFHIVYPFPHTTGWLRPEATTWPWS